MSTWVSALIPPFLALQDVKPESVHRREVEDGLALLAALYAPSEERPNNLLRVFVEFRPRLADIPCPPMRCPTFEELQDAVNRFLPEGAVGAPAALISMGSEAVLDIPEEAQRLWVDVSQVGHVHGSPAARGVHVLQFPNGGPDAN